MPRPRILPSDQQLEQWVKEGLTHEQIAERVRADTGQWVARSSVSVAIARAGLSEHHDRFDEEIPWRLKGKDLKAYPIRMLRLLGHRRRGHDLTVDENRRLDSWLSTMEAHNAVVAFDPDSDPGIFYIDREEGDALDGIPIRRERVYLTLPKD